MWTLGPLKTTLFSAYHKITAPPLDLLTMWKEKNSYSQELVLFMEMGSCITGSSPGLHTQRQWEVYIHATVTIQSAGGRKGKMLLLSGIHRHNFCTVKIRKSLLHDQDRDIFLKSSNDNGTELA